MPHGATYGEAPVSVRRQRDGGEDMSKSRFGFPQERAGEAGYVG